MDARNHVYDTVSEALTLLRQVAEPSTGVDGPTPQPGDRQAAEVSRSLLRSADLLELAANEVRILYWRHKGMRDPRAPEPEEEA